jgi:hypothetical protein
MVEAAAKDEESFVATLFAILTNSKPTVSHIRTDVGRGGASCGWRRLGVGGVVEVGRLEAAMGPPCALVSSPAGPQQGPLVCGISPSR